MSQEPRPTEPLILVAQDGYPLSAHRYRGQVEPVGHIVMAGATAVPQRFYRRFAEYASTKGFNVLTLDYRGVGESRPATLRGFETAYLDWGRLDLAAAVEHVSQDGLPVFWVGHSFGGHGLGMLPNHDRVKAAYCFATGAGWAGWMTPLEAFRVRLLWYAVLPPLVAWKGYMPCRLLGMGEDLPLGVYRDWKHWCTFPNYLFDDPNMKAVAEGFADVRTPCVFANASDDAYAPPRSRDAFIQGYRQAPVHTLDLDPGPQGIGHMGYFRAASSPLWADALQFFMGQLRPAAAINAAGASQAP